ncbi:MAG: hypothetical protein WCL32_24490, partial [Planctomycetota bacterium]
MKLTLCSLNSALAVVLALTISGCSKRAVGPKYHLEVIVNQVLLKQGDTVPDDFKNVCSAWEDTSLKKEKSTAQWVTPDEVIIRRADKLDEKLDLTRHSKIASFWGGETGKKQSEVVNGVLSTETGRNFEEQNWDQFLSRPDLTETKGLGLQDYLSHQTDSLVVSLGASSGDVISMGQDKKVVAVESVEKLRALIVGWLSDRQNAKGGTAKAAGSKSAKVIVLYNLKPASQPLAVESSKPRPPISPPPTPQKPTSTLSEEELRARIGKRQPDLIKLLSTGKTRLGGEAHTGSIEFDPTKLDAEGKQLLEDENT